MPCPACGELAARRVDLSRLRCYACGHTWRSLDDAHDAEAARAAWRRRAPHRMVHEIEIDAELVRVELAADCGAEVWP